MKKLSLAVLFTILAFFTAGCIGRFPAEYSETEQLTVALPSGGTLGISTQNGAIKVRSGDVTEVQITAEKTVYSRTEEQAKQFCENTKIETRTESDGARVSVVPPRGYRRRAMIAVSFEVVVPKNCSLDLHSSNGVIEARGIAGNTEMETSNGPITAVDIGGKVVGGTSNGAVEVERVSGSAEVETSNGGITVKDIGGDVRCRTSNGNILLHDARANIKAGTSNGSMTCELPPDASASVSASAGNGKLSCEFPITIRENQISGKIGDGKYSIELRTSNGNISIEKIK